jgi:hypothetical protein
VDGRLILESKIRGRRNSKGSNFGPSLGGRESFSKKFFEKKMEKIRKN